MYDEEYLAHIGTYYSGRYPRGSGDNPYQRSKTFLATVYKCRSENMSEKEIAKSFGYTTTTYRAKISSANAEAKKYERNLAIKLKEKGWSNAAIGERLGGKGESFVRTLLKPNADYKSTVMESTKNMLKENVSKYRFIDVGSGVEKHIGISRTALINAVELLEKDYNYKRYNIKVRQIGTGKDTDIKVLAAPDVTYKDVVTNKDKIGLITDKSEDHGVSFEKIEPPRSISSSRVKVRYAEEGGIEKDGVIELRRGVEDLSLGNARYAQVRIGVDDTHYLKGMAVYGNDKDFPDGVDVIFNTNKHLGKPMMGPSDNTVLKPINRKKNPDPANPFGAAIKLDDELILAQRHYIDKDGNKQLSSLNIVNEEGDWANWRKSISSQVLSKQAPKLAQKQLDLDYDIRRDEFEDLKSLTNATVKKKLLVEFADECDSAAVHLKAAAFPRQGSFAILPFPEIKDTEVYAPRYKEGEQVALIRYPHGGKFEIPILTVNNKVKSAKDTIPNAIDAIGINSHTAETLSGADFDGDSVLVIPIKTSGIQNKKRIEELQNFDPKASYPAYDGMAVMTDQQKGKLMGEVSNLITDMTIKGASDEELIRAVKHSMVVIDAVKHELDYKQSYKDQRIAELKTIYQGGPRSGASTLISKASSAKRMDPRKEITNPKAMTPEELARYNAGKKVYRVDTDHLTYQKAKRDKDGNLVRDENGKVVMVTMKRTIESTKMAEEEDARVLSSGTQIEEVYAGYANKMKAMGDEARALYRKTKDMERSPSARIAYKEQVDSLNAKLDIAKSNAPLERKAQAVAGAKIATILHENPGMDKDDIKKMKARQLQLARTRLGAKKTYVTFTDKEWEAVQAGAISKTTLNSLLNNADADQVKKLATPKAERGIPEHKIVSIKRMLSQGHTASEIADALGVSSSTVVAVEKKELTSK